MLVGLVGPLLDEVIPLDAKKHFQFDDGMDGWMTAEIKTVTISYGPSLSYRCTMENNNTRQKASTVFHDNLRSQYQNMVLLQWQMMVVRMASNKTHIVHSSISAHHDQQTNTHDFLQAGCPSCFPSPPKKITALKVNSRTYQKGENHKVKRCKDLWSKG